MKEELVFIAFKIEKSVKEKVIHYCDLNGISISISEFCRTSVINALEKRIIDPSSLKVIVRIRDLLNYLIEK